MNTKLIEFKMSVIEYLRNEYPDNYHWYFSDNDWLICECDDAALVFDTQQLSHIYNIFCSGGMYCQGVAAKPTPLWQRELILMIEGS